MLDISAEDTESDVEEMIVINESDVTSNLSENLDSLWENYAEEKAWTLSANDGEKTIYLILKDSWGNITVVPTN